MTLITAVGWISTYTGSDHMNHDKVSLMNHRKRLDSGRKVTVARERAVKPLGSHLDHLCTYKIHDGKYSLESE